MTSFDMEWEKIHSKKKWGGYPCEDVIRFVANHYYSAENRSMIKMLDVGCGAGANTWYLAKEGFNVYAIDGSKSAIENTKRLMEDHQLRANIVCDDILDNKYEDNFFDCIIDNRTIFSTSFDNVKQIYKEMYRILKPGGRIFSSAFSVNTTGCRGAQKISENTYTGFQEGIFSEDRVVCLWKNEEEFMNLLIEIGFENVELDLHIDTKNNRKIYNEIYNATGMKGCK